MPWSKKTLVVKRVVDKKDGEPRKSHLVVHDAAARGRQALPGVALDLAALVDGGGAVDDEREGVVGGDAEAERVRA